MDGASRAPQHLKGTAMATTVAELLSMAQSDLDALFSASEPGPIPNGEAEGTAIIAPGTVFSPQIATVINYFAWQGKTFDAKAGVLRNRILPMGVDAIVAKVYEGTSWFDGKPCIVLDYSKTSFVAQWIRDEIQPDPTWACISASSTAARRS